MGSTYEAIPALYFPDPILEARNRKLLAQFNAASKEAGKLKFPNLKDLAGIDKVSRSLETDLNREIDAFKETWAKKGKDNIINISDIIEYIALQKRPELLTQDFKESAEMHNLLDVIMVESKALLEDNLEPFNDKLPSMDESAGGEHVKILVDKDRQEISRVSVEAYRLLKLNARADFINNMHLDGIDGKKGFERFEMANQNYQGIQLLENEIQTQVTRNGRVDAELLHLRQLLHTRTKAETRIFSSITYFFSNFDKLEDVNYQSLLTANLFNPGQLAIQLEQNPVIAKYILTLIENGLKYHSESRTYNRPIPYLLKINHFLKKYLANHPNPDAVRPYLAHAQKMSEKLFEYLKINGEEISKIAGLKEKEDELENKTILQKQLNFNLLQEVEYEFAKAKKASKPIPDIWIERYLSAMFYINANEGVVNNKNDQLDPYFLELKNKLFYLMMPEVSRYFKEERKGIEERKVAAELSTILPEDIFKSLGNVISSTFDFPRLTVVVEKQDKTHKNLIVDLDKFRIFDEGYIKGAMPGWAYENKDYIKLFGNAFRNDVKISSNGETVYFVVEGKSYRIDKTGALYKQIKVDGEEQLFFTVNYDAKEGNLLELPKGLIDKNRQTWLSVKPIGKGNERCIAISDIKTGTNQYLLKDRRLTKINPDGSSTGYHNVNIAEYEKKSKKLTMLKKLI